MYILFSCPLGSWVSLWNFETIRRSLMTPKWQKLANLAQEICTLWFQFFGAVFASEGYPFKNILEVDKAVPLLMYMLCDIINNILNILSLICYLKVAQV